MGIGQEQAKAEEKNEEKTEEKPPLPFVLFVDLHCVGCAKKIEKSLFNIRGLPSLHSHSYISIYQINFYFLYFRNTHIKLLVIVRPLNWSLYLLSMKN